MTYNIIDASGSRKTACMEQFKKLLPDFDIYDFDTIGVPDNADKKWRRESTEIWEKQSAGFNKLSLNVVPPTLTSKADKALLKPSFIDSKKNTFESALSEQVWLNELRQIELLIDGDSAFVRFYQSVQVSGVKKAIT